MSSLSSEPRGLDTLQVAEQAKRDREAPSYDRFFPAAFVKNEVRRAMGLVGPADTEDSWAADLGAGTGRMTVALRALGWRTASVDMSMVSLRLLRSKQALREPSSLGVLGDVSLVPLRSGQFDLVVAGQLLQHLTTLEKRSAFVDEALRLLKPDGRLVLTCYGYNIKNRLRGRVSRWDGLFIRRHSRRELARVLRRKFRRVRVWAMNGLPSTVDLPELDERLSNLPGYGHLGRTLLAVATNGQERL